MVASPGNLISTSPRLVHGSFTVTAVFTQPIQRFSWDDLQVINAELSNLYRINASTFSFLVTPKGSGTVAVSLREPDGQPSPPRAATPAFPQMQGNRLLRIADLNGPLMPRYTPASTLVNTRFGVEASFSEDNPWSSRRRAGTASTTANVAEGDRSGNSTYPQTIDIPAESLDLGLAGFKQANLRGAQAQASQAETEAEIEASRGLRSAVRQVLHQWRTNFQKRWSSPVE